MKKLIHWIGAIALILSPTAALAQTSVGKPIAAPAGFIPSTAIYCDDGTGRAVMCTFTGGGGGGGGDPSSTGIAGSTAVPNTVGMAGLYDGTTVRRWLSDNAGRGYVNVYSLPALAAGSNTIGTVNVGGLRYQLLGTYGGSGASASGTAVGPVVPGAYMFSCSGTIGGGTITFQVLGPDGTTFQTVAGVSFTSLPSTVGVVMPNIAGGAGAASVTAANARAVLTGATSASVFCSLS